LNTLSAEWKKIFFIIYKLTPKFVTNTRLLNLLLQILQINETIK